MKALPLAERFIPWVVDGRKTSTIRLGKRNYGIGDSFLVSRGASVPIEIVSVSYSTVGALDEYAAKTEGYDSVLDLKRELRHFYPNLAEDSHVTVVRFKTK
jgi:hypothetical protein